MSMNAESSRLRPDVPSVIDVIVTLSADGDAAETASLRRSCLSESKAALVPCMRTPMSTWYWDVESKSLTKDEEAEEDEDDEEDEEDEEDEACLLNKKKTHASPVSAAEFEMPSP